MFFVPGPHISGHATDKDSRLPESAAPRGKNRPVRYRSPVAVPEQISWLFPGKSFNKRHSCLFLPNEYSSCASDGQIWKYSPSLSALLCWYTWFFKTCSWDCSFVRFDIENSVKHLDYTKKMWGQSKQLFHRSPVVRLADACVGGGQVSTAPSTIPPPRLIHIKWEP